MTSLAELMKQKLKDQENSKNHPKEEIPPEIAKISKKMLDVKKVSKSVLTSKIKTCPTCDKRTKISGEKSMNKQEIISWFRDFLSENEKTLPLDWLRGEKLSFESVNEMRK